MKVWHLSHQIRWTTLDFDKNVSLKDHCLHCIVLRPRRSIALKFVAETRTWAQSYWLLSWNQTILKVGKNLTFSFFWRSIIWLIHAMIKSLCYCSSKFLFLLKCNYLLIDYELVCYVAVQLRSPCLQSTLISTATWTCGTCRWCQMTQTSPRLSNACLQISTR